jgi:hypothetical protein
MDVGVEMVCVCVCAIVRVINGVLGKQLDFSNNFI